MSSRLEQFIRDNREQFDSEDVNPSVWKGLEKKLFAPKTSGKVISMNLFRWSAAAAVIIVGLLVTYYFVSNRSSDTLAVTNAGNGQTNDIISEINPAYAKEVYHFTQLIELKQSELKQIEKEQPELYREFISDINTLDSSYNALKKELPQNPNREQLLEAMIQNLQLQTELLNQQLMIIQKLKQKNNSDESKTI